MKIREGFVSNSSSSSFVIGIKNSTKDEVTLLDCFELSDDTYSKIKVKGKNEIIQYLVAEDYPDASEIVDINNKMAESKCTEFALINIVYDDAFLLDVFEKKNKIEAIWGSF